MVSTDRNPSFWMWMFSKKDFLTLSDKEIPRIPDTHMSGVIMRNYSGELEEALGPNHTWPDAVIYNNAKEVAHRQDQNEMTPQFKRLYPYIK